MLQFGLRTLLALTVAAAMLFCVLFTLPGWLGCSLLFLSTLPIPALLAAGIVYGRGYGRAFAIGAATLSWTTLLILLVGVGILLYSVIGMATGEVEDWREVGEEVAELFDQETGIGVKVVLVVHGFLLVMSGLVAMFVRRISLASPAETGVQADRPSVTEFAREASSPLEMTDWNSEPTADFQDANAPEAAAQAEPAEIRPAS